MLLPFESSIPEVEKEQGTLGLLPGLTINYNKIEFLSHFRLKKQTAAKCFYNWMQGARKHQGVNLTFDTTHLVRLSHLEALDKHKRDFQQ